MSTPDGMGHPKPALLQMSISEGGVCESDKIFVKLWVLMELGKWQKKMFGDVCTPVTFVLSVAH